MGEEAAPRHSPARLGDLLFGTNLLRHFVADPLLEAIVLGEFREAGTDLVDYGSDTGNPEICAWTALDLATRRMDDCGSGSSDFIGEIKKVRRLRLPALPVAECEPHRS
jgi:hypothetical protein